MRRHARPLFAKQFLDIVRSVPNLPAGQINRASGWVRINVSLRCRVRCGDTRDQSSPIGFGCRSPSRCYIAAAKPRAKRRATTKSIVASSRGLRQVALTIAIPVLAPTLLNITAFPADRRRAQSHRRSSCDCCADKAADNSNTHPSLLLTTRTALILPRASAMFCLPRPIPRVIANCVQSVSRARWMFRVSRCASK